MIIVGMISGTSADGIEAAVVEINGAPPVLAWKLLKHLHVDYSGNLRDEIVKCFRPADGTVDRLCALNFHIGQAFADAALAAIQAAGLQPAQVDLIGSHGQTVWHIPFGADASTLQLGEPAVIAERTGITTISNFRTRDMAAGGQGAPLVPLLDVLVLSHPTLTRGALNIGGIGNITYLPPTNPATRLRAAQNAFAFDTGPGNMLIDYAASRATNGAWQYDHDGVLAAQGRVDKILLDELMQEPFLKLKPPKTTGRELFGAQYGVPVWERAKKRGLPDNDIVATITAFTAHSIAQALNEFLPTRIDELIVSGGGAENPTLMKMLRDLMTPARVIRSDDFGLPTEAKEAIAFAVLAYETFFNRAGNVPAATGARHPVILGNLTPGKSPISHVEVPNLTEAHNPATQNIDSLSSLDIVRLMNDEDATVARAVTAELKNIAQAIDQIAERMQRGGRLIYIGAGTSGRLGVLDAAECPPTFSASPDQVIALIAGGARALTQAVEGAEDDADAGARDIAMLNVSENDSVVGIAASGRTPYVIGGMRAAKSRGAFVASIACNRPAPIEDLADVGIAPLVGPEIIGGSTRLKAGTAQKMVLNMLSTGAMIRLGKTFGNLMVDVQATNSKLRERARRIVATACDISMSDADELLTRCNGEVKTAIVSQLARTTADQARKRLAAAKGSVRAALTTNGK